MPRLVSRNGSMMYSQYSATNAAIVQCFVFRAAAPLNVTACIYYIIRTNYHEARHTLWYGTVDACNTKFKNSNSSRNLADFFLLLLYGARVSLRCCCCYRSGCKPNTRRRGEKLYVETGMYVCRIGYDPCRVAGGSPA